MATDPTLKAHLRWLKTRQQWAKACLHDATKMVVGQVLVDNAREDLAHTTALLALLTEETPRPPVQPKPEMDTGDARQLSLLEE